MLHSRANNIVNKKKFLEVGWANRHTGRLDWLKSEVQVPYNPIVFAFHAITVVWSVQETVVAPVEPPGAHVSFRANISGMIVIVHILCGELHAIYGLGMSRVIRDNHAIACCAIVVG